MSYSTASNNMELNSNYIYDVLNYTIEHRCQELTLLIDRCTTKELHDIFPYLIKSIFGVPNGLGWGFRTVTPENNPSAFDYLYNFFIPLGPMFRMCYRLLNEPIKFDVPIELLPDGTVQMLHTNGSQFYSEMITIDLRHRQITSLSLNAFDYYILHFTLHGMVPLHQMYPSALSVHNERWKTIYFYLTADYLCEFLPCSPDAVVMPTNIGISMKMSTQMPIQPIKPTRSPKYLKQSALTHTFSSTSPTNVRTSTDTSRTYSWRSESVLHLFIDTWLRYNVEQSRDLPSSEFIRVVRILVKRLHAFGNSAEWDNTSMSYLRKLAQPLMNEQMYIFLRNVISRWPLDSSFSVVLELWLSFIQPWRYTYETMVAGQSPIAQLNQLRFIPKKYELFIMENLIIYTQIFVQQLPRFIRLDYSSLKNVLMLYRLIKVFAQANLIDILYRNENSLFANKMINGSNSQHHQHGQTQSQYGRRGNFNQSMASSPIIQHTIYQNQNRLSNDFNRRNNTRSFSQLEHSPTSNLTNNMTIIGNNTSNSMTTTTTGQFHEENYICLFGPQINEQLHYLVNKILIAKEIEIEHIEDLKREQQQKYKGFWKTFLSFFMVNDDFLLLDQTITDSKKIPGILDNILQPLCEIFEIELPDSSLIDAQNTQYSWDNSKQNQFESHLNSTVQSENSDAELCISPLIMKKRSQKIEYTGDPDLIPIGDNEVTFLVRFLYKLSSKLNLMYSNEMYRLWQRTDKWGQLSRQLLEPPIITKTFDKSKSITRLLEKPLGPRISLRFLAKYPIIFLIICSILFGHFVFGMSSIGLILLLFIFIFYKFCLTFFYDKNPPPPQAS